MAPSYRDGTVPLGPARPGLALGYMTMITQQALKLKLIYKLLREYFKLVVHCSALAVPYSDCMQWKVVGRRLSRHSSAPRTTCAAQVQGPETS